MQSLKTFSSKIILIPKTKKNKIKGGTNDPNLDQNNIINVDIGTL